jgi:DNA-binding transcriptional MocR family regulator
VITRFSRYGAASVEPSPVNRMMAAFAGGFRDGIDCNLGVGYVNEDTIPVGVFEEALHAVASCPERYRQAFNYGSSAGSANLTRSLARFIGAPAEGKRLIVDACGATSLLEAVAEILEPGVVVTSDPAYYIYADTLERKGFEILAVPEDDEGIDPKKLRSKLGDVDRIAFFYVVTVNNPSCTVLSNRRRRELLDMAGEVSRRAGRKVPVIFDLAYELLLHDPAIEPFRSVLPDDSLGIAYEIGTLSKVLAPALRIGYMLGLDGPLMDAVTQKTSDTGFSAPLFVQEMASWMLDYRICEQLRAVNAGYRAKALAVREAIESQLGPVLEECRGGSAGFYFYLTFKSLETHKGSDFFRRLTRDTGEPRVIYVPGEHCVHPRGELAEKGRRQLRLSYGYEPAESIVRAIATMREAAEEVSGA